MSNHEVLKVLQQRMRSEIAKGVQMSKKISSGGLFTEDTYDTRNVSTPEEIAKLSREGFYVNEDLGTLVYNALMESED